VSIAERALPGWPFDGSLILLPTFWFAGPRKVKVVNIDRGGALVGTLR
jgi:hypothetical protein